MNPNPIEVVLPSGKKVQMQSYISARTMMEFGKIPRTATPRERFASLVSRCVIGEEVSAQEISELRDDDLLRIGESLKLGYEEELDKTEGPDFFARFFKVLDGHADASVATWEKAFGKHSPFAQTFRQMEQLKWDVPKLDIPKLEPSPLVELSQYAKNLPEVQTNKLLTELIDEQRNTREVQQNVVSVLDQLTKDSATANKGTTSLSKWTLFASIVSALAGIVGVIVAIIALNHTGSANVPSAPHSHGPYKYRNTHTQQLIKH